MPYENGCDLHELRVRSLVACVFKTPRKASASSQLRRTFALEYSERIRSNRCGKLSVKLVKTPNIVHVDTHRVVVLRRATDKGYETHKLR